MSLKHLKIDAEVEQTNIDTLPGSDFTVPTGLYEMIISSAYVLASANGSEGLHFTLKPADGSRQEVRCAYYMTGGKEKRGNPYYINPQGKKQYPKGFVQANHLAQIACGKPVADLKEEEKTLKLWNSANRAEENTKVRWLPELVGKPVLAAILRVRQNRKRPVNGKWIKLPTEQ